MDDRWLFCGEETHQAVPLPLTLPRWTSYTDREFLPPLLDIQASSLSDTTITDPSHNDANLLCSMYVMQHEQRAD